MSTHRDRSSATDGAAGGRVPTLVFPPKPTDMSLDGLTTLVNQPRKRHVIAVLADRGEIVQSELVDAVLERERETGESNALGGQGPTRGSVKATLSQNHLRGLEADDVIVVDRQGAYNVVKPGDAFEAVANVLDHLRAASDGGERV